MKKDVLLAELTAKRRVAAEMDRAAMAEYRPMRAAAIRARRDWFRQGAKLSDGALAEFTPSRYRLEEDRSMPAYPPCPPCPVSVLKSLDDAIADIKRDSRSRFKVEDIGALRRWINLGQPSRTLCDGEA